MTDTVVRCAYFLALAGFGALVVYVEAHQLLAQLTARLPW